MKSSKLSTSLINATLYQLGWFACVLGAADGWWFEGALVAFSLSALHLLLAERPVPEAKLVAAAGLLGIVIDTLHARSGVLIFEGQIAVGSSTIAPLWIVALWVQFGTVLHFCMRWLSGRYRLAALLGMIGGPVSFLAGERLGAAQFGEPRALSIALLALSWSIALPVLVAIADRLSGPGRYRSLSKLLSDPAVVSQ